MRFRSRAGILAAALAAATLVAPAQHASAATPSSGTLTSTTTPVTWTGSFNSADDPADVFTVTVNLPTGVWSQPGGVQFGIRFPYDPSNNDLDLYVYDANGDEIASSAYGDENAESVILPSLPNGTYTVEVVPFTANNGISYEGLVEVEYFPTVTPLRDLLPNLISLPQRNVTFESTTSPLLPYSSCRPEEVAEQGARRCLRFDQIIGNVGNGPLEIRYELEGAATDQRLLQRVYRSDGTFYERFAEKYVFHAAHAHFHYANFAISKLWRSNPAGIKLGSAPVREGRKNGFCLIDVENIWYGQKGDAARRYTSCLPADETEEGAGQINGISVGWGDVYNWYLADQYIEVSGVADGYYILETIADPNGGTAGPTGTIVETSDADNSVQVHIEICGNQAGIVGPGNPC